MITIGDIVELMKPYPYMNKRFVRGIVSNTSYSRKGMMYFITIPPKYITNERYMSNVVVVTKDEIRKVN